MRKIVVSALVLTALASAQLSIPTQLQEPEPGQTLTLTAQSSHPYVLTGATQDVYLYLSLVAKELPRIQRPPINLALVIDRSGSMASEDKLVFALSAAEQLVGRLRPDDRLAVVAYDDTIETAVPSTPVRERTVFLDAIRRLRTGGATDLLGGMSAGHEEVSKSFDSCSLNRVLLLSDGLVTAGVKDPFEIRRQAADYRKGGVRVSTMGMGLSYDDELLSGIAQNAGGNYYYVDQPESVGDFLDREIDQLSRTAARDLQVRIELGPWVESWEVFGYAPHLETSIDEERAGEQRCVVVPISDMASGERRKVVVRLRMRSAKGPAGSQEVLAKTTVRYREIDSPSVLRKAATTVRQRCTGSPEQVELSRNLQVLIKAEVVRNAEALLASMKLQKQGSFAAAQELLESRYRNSKLINDTEYRSAELTKMLKGMHQTLLDLERTASDARARRSLQLHADLRGLGYMGDD